MSLEQDTSNIKKLIEADDPFKGVSREDIGKRQDQIKAAEEKKWQKWEKKTGKKRGICPKCGENFMDPDGDGIHTIDKVTEYSDWIYLLDENRWEFVDSQPDAREIEEIYCGKCDQKLDREEYGIDIW